MVPYLTPPVLGLVDMCLLLGALETLFLLIDRLMQLQEIRLPGYTVKLGFKQPHPTLVFPIPTDTLGQNPLSLVGACLSLKSFCLELLTRPLPVLVLQLLLDEGPFQGFVGQLGLAALHSRQHLEQSCRGLQVKRRQHCIVKGAADWRLLT